MHKHEFPEPAALSSVAKFHDVFNLPVLSTPAIPSKEGCNLRYSLLADALADLQYVLSGAVLELGLGHHFKQLFDEVQRSNMSKTCQTIEEARATQSHYLESKGIESYIVEREGEYLVYRKEDGKVLKSVNYSPANLAAIVGDSV